MSLYWLKRVRDLTPAVTKLLGVRHVWCDTKSEQNSQKFVLWAGYLLEKRCVPAWTKTCQLFPVCWWLWAPAPVGKGSAHPPLIACPHLPRTKVAWKTT